MKQVYRIKLKLFFYILITDRRTDGVVRCVRPLVYLSARRISASHRRNTWFIISIGDRP